MNDSNNNKILCEFIERELLPPDSGISVGTEDDLLSFGYLDSMQFMRLVQFVENTHDLVIPPEDLLIENFQTVSALSTYLDSRAAKQ